MNSIRSIRKELGLTLLELGEMTSLSQSCISRVENEERNLSRAAEIRVECALLESFEHRIAKREMIAISLRQSVAKKVMIEAIERFVL